MGLGEVSGRMFPVKTQPGRGLMRYLALKPGNKKVGEERGLQRGQHQRDPAIIPDTFSVFMFKAMHR